MVNRRFWLAVALMLGIVVVGCVIEEKIKGKVEKDKIPAPKGKVIIYNIPEKYNDSYIYLVGYSYINNEDYSKDINKDYLLGFTDVRYPGTGTDELKLATISNRIATVPVYIIDDDATSLSGYIKAYSGNDIFYGHIVIVSTEDDVDNDGYFIRYEIEKFLKEDLPSHYIRGEKFSKGDLTVVWPAENN